MYMMSWEHPNLIDAYASPITADVASLSQIDLQEGAMRGCWTLRLRQPGADAFALAARSCTCSVRLPRADACQMVVALTPLFLLKKMYSK
jgi:hypothetical protein